MIDPSDSLARLVSVVLAPAASEEDVKIRVAMPFLRSFGYEDDDFGYEGRTGKGYVDIATSTLPVGIVVETKGPSSPWLKRGSTRSILRTTLPAWPWVDARTAHGRRDCGLPTNELPRTGGHPFYQRLNQVLDDARLRRVRRSAVRAVLRRQASAARV